MRGIKFTLHDLRRTFSSGLASRGTPPHIIERCLNHVTGQISGAAATYNRYCYLPEMRLAFEMWEARLTQLLDKPPEVASLFLRPLAIRRAGRPDHPRVSESYCLFTPGPAAVGPPSGRPEDRPAGWPRTEAVGTGGRFGWSACGMTDWSGTTLMWRRYISATLPNRASINGKMHRTGCQDSRSTDRIPRA